MKTFKEELRDLINHHSKENGSDTPDFILAEYLENCLNNFDTIINKREKWFGRTTRFSKDPITYTEYTIDPIPIVTEPIEYKKCGYFHIADPFYDKEGRECKNIAPHTSCNYGDVCNEHTCRCSKPIKVSGGLNNESKS